MKNVIAVFAMLCATSMVAHADMNQNMQNATDMQQAVQPQQPDTKAEEKIIPDAPANQANPGTNSDTTAPITPVTPGAPGTPGTPNMNDSAPAENPAP